MKKVIFLLTSIMLSMMLSAQTLEVNPKNGKYRITESNQQDDWQKEESSWDKGAEKYIDYFSKAKANPDKFLVINVETKFIKMVGVFKRLDLVTAIGIKYESDRNHFTFVKDDVPKEESSLLLLVVMLAVAAMIIFNTSNTKNVALRITALIAAVITTVVVAVITPTATAVGLTAFIATVAATGTASFTVADKLLVSSNGLDRKISSAIYYIAIATCLLFMFGVI